MGRGLAAGYVVVGAGRRLTQQVEDAGGVPEVGAGREDAFFDELGGDLAQAEAVARRAWARVMAVGLSRVSLPGSCGRPCSEAERRGRAFNLRAPRCGRGVERCGSQLCRRGRGCRRGRAVWRSCGR